MLCIRAAATFVPATSGLAKRRWFIHRHVFNTHKNSCSHAHIHRSPAYINAIVTEPFRANALNRCYGAASLTKLWQFERSLQSLDLYTIRLNFVEALSRADVRILIIFPTKCTTKSPYTGSWAHFEKHKSSKECVYLDTSDRFRWAAKKMFFHSNLIDFRWTFTFFFIAFERSIENRNRALDFYFSRHNNVPRKMRKAHFKLIGHAVPVAVYECRINREMSTINARKLFASTRQMYSLNLMDTICPCFCK